MALGEIKAYGRAVRGPLNARFLAYVRWLVEVAGTADMRFILSSRSIHVSFWIHGKQVRRRHTPGLLPHEVHGEMRNRVPSWRLREFMRSVSERGYHGAPRDALLRTPFLYDYQRRKSPTRFVIQIGRLALIQPRLLAQTIIHELKHVEDALKGRLVGRTQDVERRAYNAEGRVLALTDRELARAYQEHFGDVLAERLGRKPMIVPREVEARDDLREALREVEEEFGYEPDWEAYDPTIVPYRPASRAVRVRRKPR